VGPRRLRKVPLILLSGRPGAGKTAVGQQLATARGFIHIETDTHSGTWGPLLCAGSLDQAIATRNYARNLGDNIVVEWGFPVSLLRSVGLLRTAGFDAWWLDGEERAARQGYLRRHGSSPQVLANYDVQVSEIQAAFPRIEKFYGDHIIQTVADGPTYLPPEEVASLILGE
jgi:hypothetical protein